ncbi:MAG: N-acetyl-gamma-glutamyl-phosphate reductase [Clostridiales bacterium]|nr:N-acetyl-gamma-glutamyl-phosphate reductase [Candidatus Equinaster intestinalis]
MKKVFIDGSAGTTGLRIYERLQARSDIELLTLGEDLRKNENARREMINKADIVFLCLPDAAAIEAVGLCENENTVIIDTSTAHRTKEGWTYGFPEIAGLREQIKSSKRIANPGCHASGFIALIAPLTERGILDKNAKLSCFSLTGYSGGGKKMIADYNENGEALVAPRTYGLTQNHKHLPEMQKICGLEFAPIFSPIVSSYYSGMEVVVQLFAEDIKGNIETIKNTYKNYYKGEIVRFTDNADENGFLSAGAFSGDDSMQISVFGNDERITLVSRFDNLGKGASGAAIQNMNILLGVAETTGLDIGGR